MNSGTYYLQFFDPKTNTFKETDSSFSFSRFFNPSGSSQTSVVYIQVAMTGITGLGANQTPFTGITGYYSAIDANPLPTESNNDVHETNNYVHKTSSLSGIRFNCPISSPRIEMEQIDIGDSNLITGHATGINIGSRNSIFSNSSKELFVLIQLTGITGLGAGQTPFTGVTGTKFIPIRYGLIDRNLNFGFENTIDTTEAGYNFGEKNVIRAGKSITQLGLDLESINTKNSTIIGKLNYVFSGDKVLVVGDQNSVIAASQLGVFGNSNDIEFYNGNILGHGNSLDLGNFSNANIFGDTNTIRDSFNLNIFGKLNYVSGLNSSFVIGDSNLINSTGDITNSNLLILGDNNIALNSNEQILIGEENSVENSYQNILFGKNISSFGNNNLSFGKQNLARGSNNSIYGKQNTIDSFSQDNFVVGSNNNLSGTNFNTIIGSSNISNRDLFDSLYLQQLTGITGLGAGQTPFTGVTGYKIGGGYTGIEIVGGNSNFFVGDLNQGTLNISSYIFGKNNSLLNNINANIFGSSNYLERSQNSYILGENNIVSGFENYVIGNNNIVRGGDYNSILIGISHEFTGEFKAASVNIASVDSKIEINPSEIKLYAANKPKFNDQEMVIANDISALQDAIIANKTSFTSSIFQDPNYDKLSAKVFVPSFAYDSGAATAITTAEQNFESTQSLTVDKFNIFAQTSYTGDNGFCIIYGNHRNPKFDPAWMIVDRQTSGVYYKNDKYTQYETPQTGWYPTGFRDGDNVLYTGTTNNLNTSIVIGPFRTGYLSVKDSSLGTVYLPYFY